VPAALLDVEQAARLERKRKVSREWHAKWKAKGVPRREAEGQQDTGAAVEVVDDDDADANIAPADRVKAESNASVGSSLQHAMNKFMQNWLAASSEPPSKARRTAALQAWMTSPERVALLAARKAIVV
jgi:hypothetical protein